jgi:tetratricopeptide (TPR) repeat protein
MRAVGDRAGEAATLTGIGVIYGELGERERALEHFEQALPLSRTVGDRDGEAMTLHNMSFLTGRAEAIKLVERALELWTAVGSPEVRRAEARLAELRGE